MRPHALIRSLCFLVCAVSQLTATCYAQEKSPTREALTDTPWFDASEKSLVPIFVEDATDDSVNRHSRWLPKAKKIKKPASTTTTGGGGGVGGSGSFSMANAFGWMLLTLLIVSAVGLLVYAFSKAEIELGSSSNQVIRRQTSGEGPDEITLERMKHLPAELRRTDVNLRTEAERLMNEQQFDQAIILLFGHQLLMLDRAGLLRLTRGKTNGRYVRESRSADRECGDRLRMTATAFERSYFGRHQITPAEFAKFWSNNEALEQRIQLRQEVAA